MFHKNDEKSKNCANVRQNISENEMAIWRCNHCKKIDETSKQFIRIFQSKNSKKKESIENIQTESEEIIQDNSDKTHTLDIINRNRNHSESINQNVIQIQNEIQATSPIKCDHCNLEFIKGKILTCINCKKNFHKSKKCTGIHGNKKLKEYWKCSNCN